MSMHAEIALSTTVAQLVMAVFERNAGFARTTYLA